MKLINDCLDLPLISLDTSEEIGRLTHCLTDPVANRIIGFAVTSSKWFAEPNALVFNDVAAFGVDAIIVTALDAVKPISQVATVHPFVHDGAPRLIRQAVSSDGQSLGTLTDWAFDEQSGEITQCRLEGPNGEETWTPRASFVRTGKAVAILDPAHFSSDSAPTPGGGGGSDRAPFSQPEPRSLSTSEGVAPAIGGNAPAALVTSPATVTQDQSSTDSGGETGNEPPRPDAMEESQEAAPPVSPKTPQMAEAEPTAEVSPDATLTSEVAPESEAAPSEAALEDAYIAPEPPSEPVTSSPPLLPEQDMASLMRGAAGTSVETSASLEEAGKAEALPAQNDLQGQTEVSVVDASETTPVAVASSEKPVAYVAPLTVAPMEELAAAVKEPTDEGTPPAALPNAIEPNQPGIVHGAQEAELSILDAPLPESIPAAAEADSASIITPPEAPEPAISPLFTDAERLEASTEQSTEARVPETVEADVVEPVSSRVEATLLSPEPVMQQSDTRLIEPMEERRTETSAPETALSTPVAKPDWGQELSIEPPAPLQDAAIPTQSASPPVEQQLKEAINRNKDGIIPFVVGKYADRDIMDSSGNRIVAQGEKISADMADQASRSWKLYDLWIAAQATPTGEE